jgi:hypothetical protein
VKERLVSQRGILSVKTAALHAINGDDSMNFDLAKHTIFRTLTGSRVYGTFTEESDYDYRGVAIPPEIYFLGYAHKFDQHESSSPHDSVIYGISKFLKLAVDNNPNIIELLYIKPEFWTTTSPAWERLVEHRDWFLCKKSFHTFRGYAAAQMKRVRSHRNWLLQGELKLPTREEFGLPPTQTIPHDVRVAAEELAQRFTGLQDVEDALGELSHVDKSLATALRQRLYEFVETATSLSRPAMEERIWKIAAVSLGYETNFIRMLQMEKQFRQAKQHYDSWLHWKAERNEKRKEIEARCGFDSKHVGHTYRLAYMCREILQNHTLTVTRPEAEFLKEIREGRYTFEEVEHGYNELDKELEGLYVTSTLQNQPRRNDVEELGVDIIREFLKCAG